MARRRSALIHVSAFLLMLLICAPELVASDNKQPQTPASPAPTAPQNSDAPKLTSQTRLALIRSLQSERVFSRVLFPQGKQGLSIRNGVIKPGEMAVAQMVAENGAAAKPGDRCVITAVDIRDKEVILEINGGPKKGEKWYRRIQVGGAGGAASPIPNTSASPQSLDAHGSVVKIEFDKYVPEMTGDELRAMLAPVFDFKALTTAEAYEKTLPPKVQEAIKNHQILVGMDKEMVVYAKGRAPRKIRDKDAQGNDYEEWIYGNPPEEVNFVRFKGNEVAWLEIMTVDGQKIIKTEKEVDLKSKESEVADKKAAPKPANAPTLMRPGEEAVYAPQPSQSQGTRPPDQQGPPNRQPYPAPTNIPGSDPDGSTPPHYRDGGAQL